MPVQASYIGNMNFSGERLGAIVQRILISMVGSEADKPRVEDCALEVEVLMKVQKHERTFVDKLLCYVRRLHFVMHRTGLSW